MRRTRGALLVIVMIAALIIYTTWLALDRWQTRVNPSVVNQPPAAAQTPASTTAS